MEHYLLSLEDWEYAKKVYDSVHYAVKDMFRQVGVLSELIYLYELHRGTASCRVLCEQNSNRLEVECTNMTVAEIRQIIEAVYGVSGCNQLPLTKYLLQYSVMEKLDVKTGTTKDGKYSLRMSRKLIKSSEGTVNASYGWQCRETASSLVKDYLAHEVKYAGVSIGSYLRYANTAELELKQDFLGFLKGELQSCLKVGEVQTSISAVVLMTLYNRYGDAVGQSKEVSADIYVVKDTVGVRFGGFHFAYTQEMREQDGVPDDTRFVLELFFYGKPVEGIAFGGVLSKFREVLFGGMLAGTDSEGYILLNLEDGLVNCQVIETPYSFVLATAEAEDVAENKNMFDCVDKVG